MLPLVEIEARIAGRTAGDASCLWTRAAYGYADGMARMAQWPLEDPFWTGTNRRATEHKLPDFCRTLLERDPWDHRALWTAIGLDVRHCANVLSEPAWRALLQLGDFWPPWLVEHAYWVAAVSGKDTVPLIAELLARHQLADATRPTMHALAADPHAAPWVARLLAAIS